MARISYVDPAAITDPEIRGWLEQRWLKTLNAARGEFAAALAATKR